MSQKENMLSLFSEAKFLAKLYKTRPKEVRYVLASEERKGPAMTIYKLSINEVENPTSYAIVSSHISPRRLRSVEFYLNEDRAKVRKQEIYEGARKLVGFLPNIEVCIDKLEVIE